MKPADKKRHDQLVGWFDEWENNSTQQLAIQRKHRDYYDGKQWDDDQRRVLEKRKEPVITDNVIKDKIDNLIGLEISARTDPRAFPRNPTDTEGSEAATDSLRFVADNNELQTVLSQAAECEFIEGTGALEIIYRPDGDEIGINRLFNNRIWYDLTSRELNFSDARYRGTHIWLDEDVAKQRFKGKKNHNALKASFVYADSGQRDEDEVRWVDQSGKRKRVRILETYWTEADGEVWYAKWTRGGFLTEGEEDSPGLSAYRDDRGKTAAAYEWQSAYINSEGRRYGAVERLIDLSDEQNKRRSKLLHFLNTNQLHYETGALANPAHTAMEIRKPDGVIEYMRGGLTDGRVKIDKNIEMAAANAQLLQDTRQRLDSIGPAESLAGVGGESGRHLQVQQQGQVLALGPMVDRHTSLKRRTYRAMWARIKQFWTTEKWVRVQDSENKPRFTGLNVSAESLAKTPQGQQAVMNGELLPEVMNKVSDMDFDIILTDVPDVVNLAQEQFSALVDLAKMGITFPQEFYIEVANLPNKTKLREMLRQHQESAQGQQQQQQQIQQEFIQLEKALKNSITAENMSDAELNIAKAKSVIMDSITKRQQANGQQTRQD